MTGVRSGLADGVEPIVGVERDITIFVNLKTPSKDRLLRLAQPLEASRTLAVPINDCQCAACGLRSEGLMNKLRGEFLDQIPYLT